VSLDGLIELGSQILSTKNILCQVPEVIESGVRVRFPKCYLIKKYYLKSPKILKVGVELGSPNIIS